MISSGIQPVSRFLGRSHFRKTRKLFFQKIFPMCLNRVASFFNLFNQIFTQKESQKSALFRILICLTTMMITSLPIPSAPSASPVMVPVCARSATEREPTGITVSLPNVPHATEPVYVRSVTAADSINLRVRDLKVTKKSTMDPGRPSNQISKHIKKHSAYLSDSSSEKCALCFLYKIDIE